MSRDQLNWC